LKAGRAITLCCTANRPSSSTSISSARPSGSVGPLSMVTGTPKPPMKPMAYRKVAKKMA